MPTFDDCLLTDEQVAEFVRRGYHVVTPDVPAAVHQRVCDEVEALLETHQGAFDDHTLRGGASRTKNNSNDILRQLPTLPRVCEDRRVHGALTSLLGSGYGMQVHRHVHRKLPGTGDLKEAKERWEEQGKFDVGALHQDGRFRSLHGWNRFFRHPYLPLKVIAFYYPHAVAETNGPTQCTY